MQVSEFLGQVAQIEKYCREVLGYDRAEVRDIVLDPSGSGRYTIALEDDFQADIPSELRYKSEGWTYVFFSKPDASNISLFAEWPNRAQRELRVMARQMASLRGMSDALATVEAREFVAAILRDADQMFQAIEDQRIIAQGVVLSDGESE